VDAHRVETSGASGPRFRLASPGTATALGLVALALVVLAVPFAVLAHKRWTDGLHSVPLILGWGVIGFVVARKQPRHPMGWLLLSAAIFFMLNGDASNYSVAAYRVHHGSLPLGPVAVLLQPAWAPAIVISALTLLLFPDGRLPTTRLRWLVWAFLSIAGLWMLGAYAIAAASIVGHNIHVDSSGDLVAIAHPSGDTAWWGRVQNVFFPALGVTWLMWFIAQVPGYRRSTGERRQQLKWLLSGASIFALSGLLTISLGSSGNGFVRTFGDAALVGTVALPVSIGIGILRYRLYEIDRLVSRTLSYAILTGLLVGVFLGIVALATQALPFSSPVAVAASTLAAAALFNPLRQRVQGLVDRRFNRARYDAEAIVTAFTLRLRDAVDLDTVRGELLRAVDRAVEPAHASLWLRPPNAS
jgi:hypothetical protein